MTQVINYALHLIKSGQPAYYVSTNELSEDNGRHLASTWADYIRIDFEHGPLDLVGLKNFMIGLRAEADERGVQIPAVIPELPFPGNDLNTVRANGWIIRQILALGVHGVILCHAESPEAVQQVLKEARYPLNAIVEEMDMQGLRGHGGEKFAARMWKTEPSKYIEQADFYPLNPSGQLILGVKMENPRAARKCQEIARVPGVFFGEWGLGDMSLSFGFKERPTFPLPKPLEDIRKKIWDACNENGVHFLGISNSGNIKENIDNGMMMIRCYEMDAVEVGKEYTKRGK